MKRFVLASVTAASLALTTFGCAHDMHQAAADAHHEQAKRDAKHLNLGDAVDEQHESKVEQRKADETR